MEIDVIAVEFYLNMNICQCHGGKCGDKKKNKFVLDKKN